MSGFKAKFIILLIVYFAGFATAVYLFTPVSQQNKSLQTDSDHSFTTNWFVKTLNTGLHGAVDITKTVTYNASTYIRQRNNDANQNQNTGY